MSYARGRTMGALVALGGLLLSPGTGRAQLGLRFHPEEVVVRPGEATPVFLVLESTFSTRMPISLDWVAMPGLEVELVDELPPTLGAGESLARRMVVRGQPSGENGEVSFAVASEGAGGGAHLVTATLSVEPALALSVDEVVELTARTSLTSVRDQTTDTIFVVATNPQAIPIEVGPARLHGPPFVLPDTGGSTTASVTIPPGSSGLLKIGFKIDDQVRPGPRTLVFAVPVAWTPPGGAERRGTAFAHLEIQVGVLGESEILTAMSVPSLLLLPGVLMLLAFAFVLGLAERDAGIAKDPKDLQFWMIAITLSIVVGGVAWVLDWRYLDLGYGVLDVAALWLLSVGLGAGTAAVALYVLQKIRAARLPSRDDDPLTTLEKIARRGQGSVLPTVTYQPVQNKQLPSVRLWRDEDSDKVWIMPQIRYRWTGQPAQDQLKRLWEALEEAERLPKVIKELAASLELKYAEVEGLTGPRAVGQDKLTDVGHGRYVVEA